MESACFGVKLEANTHHTRSNKSKTDIFKEFDEEKECMQATGHDL